MSERKTRCDWLDMTIDALHAELSGVKGRYNRAIAEHRNIQIQIHGVRIRELEEKLAKYRQLAEVTSDAVR